MMRWIALAVAAGLAAGLPHAFAAHGVTKLPDASAGRAAFDGGRHVRPDIMHYAPRPDPHYYARPVFYRPILCRAGAIRVRLWTVAVMH